MTSDVPADDTAETTPESEPATPPAPEPASHPTEPLPPVDAPPAPPAPTTAPAPGAPPPPAGAPRDTVPPTAPGAGAPGVAAFAPAPAPRKRGRLGQILGLSLGGFGVLVIAAIGIVVGVLTAQHAPSASVDRFLSTIEKGHATAAFAQLSPAPTGNKALVNDAVYDHVTNRVTKHQILSTTTHGSRSVVTVRLATTKGSFTQTFTLVTHRKSFIWDIWTVDGTSFPEIQLADPRPKNFDVTVDGVAIQKDGSEFDGFVALPGDYTFAFDGDTSLVTANARSVSIGSFSGRKSVTLEPRLTGDGVAQARAAVDSFIDSCIAQTVLAPTGDCGYEIVNDEPDVSIDSIQWSIKQRPVVEFDAWADGAWNVKTDTAGSFEMTGEGHLGSAHGEVGGLIDAYDVYGYIYLDDAGHLAFASDYKGDDANAPTA